MHRQWHQLARMACKPGVSLRIEPASRQMHHCWLSRILNALVMGSEPHGSIRTVRPPKCRVQTAVKQGGKTHDESLAVTFFHCRSVMSGD